MLKKQKIRIIVLVLLSVCLLFGCSISDEETRKTTISLENSSFEVHFLDVGQADSTLILCDDQAMLIDGGNTKDSSLIYAYLKEHDVAHLNYVIGTHAHEDHIGGLAGALNYATVDKVYCPVTEYDSEAFADFLKYVQKQNCSVIVPEINESFSLGFATCIFLGVNVFDGDNSNNTSIALRVDYGETSFVFSGDNETVVEEKILQSGADVQCTVIKVPHHGSDTSLSNEWLNAANPEYAVISVGENNSYGHPSESTLKKLEGAGVQIYRTDLQGHIVCKSDGEKVSFETASIENPGEYSYVVNVNTKKFHYPDCFSVNQMKEKNKVYTVSSREELVRQGYEPCGNCHP